MSGCTGCLSGVEPDGLWHEWIKDGRWFLLPIVILVLAPLLYYFGPFSGCQERDIRWIAAALQVIGFVFVFWSLRQTARKFNRLSFRQWVKRFPLFKKSSVVVVGAGSFEFANSFGHATVPTRGAVGRGPGGSRAEGQISAGPIID